MVHHLDIGAMNMGTRGWNTEIFQEGVRFAPMKLIEEGRLDQKVMSIILTNTRTPDIHENNVTSQIASVQAAEGSALGMFEKSSEERRAGQEWVRRYTTRGST